MKNWITWSVIDLTRERKRRGRACLDQARIEGFEYLPDPHSLTIWMQNGHEFHIYGESAVSIHAQLSNQ